MTILANTCTCSCTCICDVRPRTAMFLARIQPPTWFLHFFSQPLPYLQPSFRTIFKITITLNLWFQNTVCQTEINPELRYEHGLYKKYKWPNPHPHTGSNNIIMFIPQMNVNRSWLRIPSCLPLHSCDLTTDLNNGKAGGWASDGERQSTGDHCWEPQRRRVFSL